MISASSFSSFALANVCLAEIRNALRNFLRSSGDINMNAEEKLNSLIAEYRSLKTEEEKKGFDEKMRHTFSEISPIFIK